jgi:hypothetical protein
VHTSLLGERGAGLRVRSKKGNWNPCGSEMQHFRVLVVALGD